MIRLDLVATLFSFLLLIFCSSCASLTGFQTGRTVGKLNGELMASLNASQTPDLGADFDQNDTADIPTLFFPNLELGGRFGIVERFDIGLRLNSNLNVALDGRYQLVGDRESVVAVAGGFGVGIFGPYPGLWNIQIPMYFSVHPTDGLALYVNPRYSKQIISGFKWGNVRYFGLNGGVLFGKKLQFGIDAGLQRFDTKFSQFETLFTAGVGLKVPLGQFNDAKKQ